MKGFVRFLVLTINTDKYNGFAFFFTLHHLLVNFIRYLETMFRHPFTITNFY